MMHWRNVAAGAAIALALAARAAAQDPPTAEAVLHKLEAAVGKAEARAAIRSLVIKGTVSPQGMPTTASFEELHLGKERAVMVSSFPGMGEMTTGTDGKITWSVEPSMGVAVNRGKEQGGARRMLLFGRRAPWRDLYVSARLEGKETVAGRPCWKLAMKGTDGVEDVWYVDRENHDFVAADVKVPDFTGGQIAIRWQFSDYRAVAGVRYAHERRQIAGGFVTVYSVSKIDVNAVVDTARLAPPKAVLDKLARGDADPDKATAPGVVRVHELARRAVALSRKTRCKPDMISATLGQLLPKVMGTLMASGMSPAGPPFTRYHSKSKEEIVLEAGMPVARPIEEQGDIVPGWLPAGKAAIIWHHGAYKGLGETHATLAKWIEDNGYERTGAPWEVYWTDPGLEPDESKWRTQVICPVRKKKAEPAERE